ncbi:cytochrome bd-II oxidase subunit CbdX, partial [Escherichia coli]|nr:cytochrome bd-II oxidase subunit CbdX [Escherichia coli]
MWYLLWLVVILLMCWLSTLVLGWLEPR